MDYNTLSKNANDVSTKEELMTLIDSLLALPVTAKNSSKLVAIACIAMMSFMLKIQDGKLDFPGTGEDALWSLIEGAVGYKDIKFLQIIKLRQLLNPSMGTNSIYIDNQIADLLKQEAQELLAAHPDATDDMRQYWRALVKGELPQRLVIRKS